MNVYLVRRESGCYSDHLSYVDAVFATREAAETYIESIEWTYERCLDKERCDYEDAWETVTEHPKYSGKCWIVEGDEDDDSPWWFVDRMEVWGLYRPTADPFDYTPLFDLQKVMEDEPEVPGSVMLSADTDHPVMYWPVDRDGLLKVAKSMVDTDSYRFYDADRDLVSRADVFEFARQIRDMCRMSGVIDDGNR